MRSQPFTSTPATRLATHRPDQHDYPEPIHIHTSTTSLSSRVTQGQPARVSSVCRCECEWAPSLFLLPASCLRPPTAQRPPLVQPPCLMPWRRPFTFTRCLMSWRRPRSCAACFLNVEGGRDQAELRRDQAELRRDQAEMSIRPSSGRAYSARHGHALGPRGGAWPWTCGGDETLRAHNHNPAHNQPSTCACTPMCGTYSCSCT